jgi:hypothetical protein
VTLTTVGTLRLARFLLHPAGFAVTSRSLAQGDRVGLRSLRMTSGESRLMRARTGSELAALVNGRIADGW